MKQTYTIKEFAALKKVTYQTALLWVRNDKVKTEKLPSGRVLVVEDDAQEDTLK